MIVLHKLLGRFCRWSPLRTVELLVALSLERPCCFPRAAQRTMLIQVAIAFLWNQKKTLPTMQIHLETAQCLCHPSLAYRAREQGWEDPMEI